MQGPEFAEYFSNVYILTRPGRDDHLRAAQQEVARLGFQAGQVIVPRQGDTGGPGGDPAQAALLGHLAILKDISNRRLTRALVLEDDAIFRHKLARAGVQRRITGDADQHKWALWFIGHRLRQGLRGVRRDVVRAPRPVPGVHCYGVHARSVDALIGFLSARIGQPRADGMAEIADISSALRQFHRAASDHVMLVSNPAQSIRRGAAPGDQAGDAAGLLDGLVEAGRRARDGFWRQTGIDFRSGQ